MIKTCYFYARTSAICKALALCYVSILSGSMLQAQQTNTPIIHLFIVTEENANISSNVDRDNMDNFANTLNREAQISVVVKFVNSDDASKSYIEGLLRSSTIHQNDVIWYYYAGRTSNYDNWPQSLQHSVPLTWIHQMLKETGVRLTITTYECCNALSPPAASSAYVSKILSLKILFLESKGHIIMASNDNSAPSYGSNVSGGLFTNALLDGIKSSMLWEEALMRARNNTISQAEHLGHTQKPIYFIQDGGMQSTPYAPVFELRQEDLPNDVVKMVQELFDNSTTRDVTIGFEDVMRWNPGLTYATFDAFKGKMLNIDFNDTLLNAIDARFNLPRFPWPPPQCAQRQSLVEHLTYNGYRTFADVDLRIRGALDANGYSQKSYFQVPNGFALVTQLEQFNDDGSSKTGDTRWAEYPEQEYFKGFWDYLVSIILPPAEHYRMFVFVVTDTEYNLASRRIKREEAELWLEEGLNRLPGSLGTKGLTSRHNLDVLIYEFETPSTTKVSTLKCSDTKDIITHLRKSGIGLISLKK